MRIIAGQFKGAKLNAPQDNTIRPTTDRVRESLFNTLNNRFDHHWDDKKVLDLFAGTGALGLEALSRGAAFCIFVETSAPARGLVRGHIDQFGLGGRSRLLRRSATDLGPTMHDAPVNLAFVDPPYGQGLAEQALHHVAEQGWLGKDATIVVEEAKSNTIELAAQFMPIDHRTYGDTQISLYRYQP